jgi:hypothetical protein
LDKVGPDQVRWGQVGSVQIQWGCFRLGQMKPDWAGSRSDWAGSGQAGSGQVVSDQVEKVSKAKEKDS